MRLTRLAGALALVLTSCATMTPAQADFTAKDSNSITVTFGSLNLLGVLYPKHVAVDGNGAILGVPANPMSVTCLLGCGGGSGGSVAA